MTKDRTAWNTIPKLVSLLTGHDMNIRPMQRVSTCSKCFRDDVEGLVNPSNLCAQHYWDCVDDATGVPVGGTLFACPSGKHAVCVDCIKQNWWRNQVDNSVFCTCGPWSVVTLVLAGVEHAHILQARHSRMLQLTPSHPRECRMTGDVVPDDVLSCALCFVLNGHSFKCSLSSDTTPTNAILRRLPAPPPLTVRSLTSLCMHALPDLATLWRNYTINPPPLPCIDANVASQSLA